MPVPPNIFRVVTAPKASKKSAISSCVIGEPSRVNGVQSGSSANRKEDAMPMLMTGSCRCRAVRFEVDSHTPVPYQLCYCSICRKQQGGGGYAINLAAIAGTLKVEGEAHLGLYRAVIGEGHGRAHTSSGERRFCRECGSAL